MKFEKGQKVTFVGSIGNYNSTYQKREVKCKIMRKQL